MKTFQEQSVLENMRESWLTERGAKEISVQKDKYGEYIEVLVSPANNDGGYIHDEIWDKEYLPEFLQE